MSLIHSTSSDCYLTSAGSWAQQPSSKRRAESSEQHVNLDVQYSYLGFLVHGEVLPGSVLLGVNHDKHFVLCAGRRLFLWLQFEWIWSQSQAGLGLSTALCPIGNNLLDWNVIWLDFLWSFQKCNKWICPWSLPSLHCNRLLCDLWSWKKQICVIKWHLATFLWTPTAEIMIIKSIREALN